MSEWISVEDGLPERPEKAIHQFSKSVMLTILDPNWEPDGIPRIDAAFPNRWRGEGRLFFPTSGGSYWVDLEERPVEELGVLVTHWREYPELPPEAR